MAIQISYQPAAATIGGMAGLAGSAQYMQQLYPQLVQQQQFAAQQEQQRQMAMFEAAVRERAQQQQFGQQMALQQLQGQQQIAQENLRLPARFAEIQFQNDAAAERARQQIEAQTRNEMERMRQEFDLRDRLDARSGERQEGLARSRMEMELEKLDRSNQFKAEYDATHQRNIAERQAMLERMRQTGRLSQSEFNAMQAAERQQASIAANAARWQQELELKRQAMQASLHRNFQNEIGQYALSPLQASNKVFGEMLQNGYQFSGDDAKKRALLASEISTLYATAQKDGTLNTGAVAASLRQRIADLNSIQPQPPADVTAEFQKRVVSIDIGNGVTARALPLPNGSLQMLPLPMPLTAPGQSGVDFYFDNKDGNWKPMPSKAGASSKATVAGTAASPEQYLKLLKSAEEARTSISANMPLNRAANPAEWDRAQGLLQSIDKRLKAAGQDADGQPAGQSATTPVKAVDIATELTFESGKFLPKAGSHTYIAQYNPQQYAELVRGFATSPPWNNTNPVVTNENVATEQQKPFPAPMGQPQSTIPADAWHQPAAWPAIGATAEFVKQVIPTAQSYAREIDSDVTKLDNAKFQWITNTLSVIKSVNVNAQPFEWVQMRTELGRILKEAAAKLKAAQSAATQQ